MKQSALVGSMVNSRVATRQHFADASLRAKLKVHGLSGTSTLPRGSALAAECNRLEKTRYESLKKMADGTLHMQAKPAWKFQMTLQLH